ncbi:MAG: hypothetical protein J3K34DRAFT_500186 [Monoraphidium minutum]|nr:MAG: hypothetical protein J3K34DRAFT_500186 [Monoraphidium minutum]
MNSRIPSIATTHSPQHRSAARKWAAPPAAPAASAAPPTAVVRTGRHRRRGRAAMRRFLVERQPFEAAPAPAAPPRKRQARIEELGKVVVLPRSHVGADAPELARLKAELLRFAAALRARRGGGGGRRGQHAQEEEADEEGEEEDEEEGASSGDDQEEGDAEPQQEQPQQRRQQQQQQPQQQQQQQQNSQRLHDRGGGGGGAAASGGSGCASGGSGGSGDASAVAALRQLSSYHLTLEQLTQSQVAPAVMALRGAAGAGGDVRRLAAALVEKWRAEVARAEAARQGLMFAGPEHLLLGLLAAPDGAAAAMLGARGVDAEGARARVDTLVVMPSSPEGGLAVTDVGFSPAVQAVISAAVAVAAASERRQASTAHLLCGLLQPQPLGKAVQAALEGADVDEVRRQAEVWVGEGPPEPAADAPSGGEEQAAKLQELYRAHMEQQQSRGGGGGAGGFGAGRGARPMTQAEIDDTYE